MASSSAIRTRPHEPSVTGARECSVTVVSTLIAGLRKRPRGHSQDRCYASPELPWKFLFRKRRISGRLAPGQAYDLAPRVHEPAGRARRYPDTPVLLSCCALSSPPLPRLLELARSATCRDVWEPDR